MLFCYSLTVLCIVLFTFQRPFLFSPVLPVVETEYNEREEHLLGSKPFKVFFFSFPLTLLKVVPHGEALRTL